MSGFIEKIRSHASPAWLALAAVAWLMPALLFFFLPYSEGYGAVRVPLFEQWSNICGQGEDWQHCFLVLPLALGIFVYLIQASPVPSPGTSFAGLGVVVFSAFLFWLGYRMSTHYIGFFACQGLLIGSIWFLLGGRTLLAFVFPLLFLVFAWPLPFLDNYIAFPLRVLMSHGAVFVLDTLGLEVVRNGTGILSAPVPALGIPAGHKFAVDVADPCSGIRSLFALMMVSALYAQFTLKSWWQKLVLFAFSAPLAILGNLARILMLTLGTIVFGSEFAIGKNALTDPSWFHMAAGYVVFVVALGGMAGLGSLLTSLSRRHESPATSGGPQSSANPAPAAARDDY
jgi:exosortase